MTPSFIATRFVIARESIFGFGTASLISTRAVQPILFMLTQPQSSKTAIIIFSAEVSLISSHRAPIFIFCFSKSETISSLVILLLPTVSIFHTNPPRKLIIAINATRPTARPKRCLYFNSSNTAPCFFVISTLPPAAYAAR